MNLWELFSSLGSNQIILGGGGGEGVDVKMNYSQVKFCFKYRNIFGLKDQEKNLY